MCIRDSQTLDTLLAYGVNHIDTAPRYGVAEERIGPWMDRHRKDFFLATKTGERTAEGAREELHRSLEKLRVDSVDLIQMHALSHPGGVLVWVVAQHARETRLQIVGKSSASDFTN